MTVKFASSTPVLRSFDEAKAREFYVEFLGFDVVFEHRFAPDLPLYLGLRRDGCGLHLSEHFGDATPGARLRIELEGVEAFRDALAAKRYRHARPGPPEKKPWNSLEFSVTDPFGNTLVFFETLED